ncbi:MAG TPA: PD-(D/E)XK nuclease family protein, partial [Bacteroidales bacterium]
VNHQESIYAYHFYRLLQRAENVTFLYNSSSEGLQTGEMSRFLIQMKYDELLRPVFTDLGFEIKSHASLSDRIERNEGHIRQLYSLYTDKNSERILSPSAINTWLNCRMKFFYRYVNRLKEPVNISKNIDPAMLGNILHEMMKNIYLRYTGSILTGEMLNLMIRNKQLLSKIINEAVNENYKDGRNDSVRGSELIVREVLMNFLVRILKTDNAIAPINILNLEDSFSFDLTFLLNGSLIGVLTGGKIDRIDSVNGVVRIVDYKTGNVSESIKMIDDLFTDDRTKDIDGWLQTLVYCEAYQAMHPDSVVRPSVYKIKKLDGTVITDKLIIRSDNKTQIVVDNYLTVREEFLRGLKELVSTIFNKDEPFVKTSDIRGKCSWCPYKILCMR